MILEGICCSLGLHRLELTVFGAVLEEEGWRRLFAAGWLSSVLLSPGALLPERKGCLQNGKVVDLVSVCQGDVCVGSSILPGPRAGDSHGGTPCWPAKTD